MNAPSRLIRLAVIVAAALAISLGSIAAERVALLIGNSKYSSGPLRNSANDAEDIGMALSDLGFTVIVRKDLTRQQMVEAVRDFGNALPGATTALFFYSGHAMQFKDRNYLLPIDTALGSEEDVTFFALDLQQVYDRMERAKTQFNFLILDASRESPFRSSFRVSNAGLAQISAPRGTLVAYSTSPGAVAADGFGRNGIYAKHVLQNLPVPNVPVEIMFKRVREGVERDTRKLQTPWDSSSLTGNFAFNAPRDAAAARPAAPAGTPTADTTLQIEREFWISVRDSQRAEDIKAYIEKYPAGSFIALARNRYELLSRQASAAADAVEAAPDSTAKEALAVRPSPIERRKALVIGNDTYRHVTRLTNARADARAMAKGLEAAAFQVTLKLDVSEKAMKEALRAFKAQLQGGDVAVFYYSGHGVQLGAANYILPIDIRSESEDQIRDDAIPLQRVLDDLQDQKAKFSLAIVDACRNNPFRQFGRAIGGRGLAPTTAATGQMVLYSAGTGQQALDSLGPADRSPNGLFTRVLLKEMEKAGVSVDRVLRNVREEVARLARSVNHDQVPAIYDQALGDFYFRPVSANR